MSNPLKAATIYPSVAAISAARGPDLPAYAVPLDRPALYQWIVGDQTTADNVETIGHTGGTIGRWRRVCEYDRGADLTDANQTIHVTGDHWRVMPAGTLSTNRTVTLGTTGAVRGSELTITRQDSSANTLAIANGGPGGGTLTTLPASYVSYSKFKFDGTNWVMREFAPVITAEVPDDPTITISPGSNRGAAINGAYDTANATYLLNGVRQTIRLLPGVYDLETAVVPRAGVVLLGSIGTTFTGATSATGYAAMQTAILTPATETFSAILTLDRDAVQTFSGSGALVLALATSGHFDGITKTIIVPAGTASSIILADDLNADGDSFDPAGDFAIVVARAAGRCFTALRALGTLDTTAPTIVSATVDLGVDANALVVVFNEPVYAPSITGLSLSFSSGTPRTLGAVSTGQGTTSLTFDLSGDIGGSDVFSLVVGSTRTLQSLNGPLLGTGTTPVDVNNDDLSAIAGIRLWLRADIGVTTTGGSVSQWNDQSGLANHATQASAGNRPTHVNVDPKHVSFDNTNDFLTGPISLASGGEFTLFVVRRSHADQSDSAGIFDTSNGTGTTNVGYQFLRDFPSLSARLAGANGAVYAEPSVAIRQHTCVYRLTDREIREGGVQVATNATDTTHISLTQYRIGMLFQDVLPPDCDIFELVAYARALTTGEIEQVEGILATRWGL